jgi:hypothetical protein
MAILDNTRIAKNGITHNKKKTVTNNNNEAITNKSKETATDKTTRIEIQTETLLIKRISLTNIKKRKTIYIIKETPIKRIIHIL